MTRVLRAGACAALLAGAALSAFAPAQDGPTSIAVETRRFEKSVVASGLAGPWEVTWGPDAMLWVTERTGKRVVRIHPATGDQRVAATIDEVAAPTGSAGLLGLALHPDLLRGNGNDYVYVAYTYEDRALPPDSRFADPASPFRYLYSKVVRLRYQAETGSLTDATTILSGLPTGNDHSGMRLAFAPDRTLHLSIGDMGNNQLGNFCQPVQAQRLPTRDEVARGDWSAYEGKTLRFTSDGAIPTDNPSLNGVISHVYTYGHRNPQGLAFGPDGTLFATDHGPKSDDEVNVLVAGANYGWPHVAGFRDDKSYEYARWADATTPCGSLRFSDLAIPASVPRAPESAFTQSFVEPLATLFSVPAGFSFEDPACGGIDFICWPTVAASSLEYYGGRGAAGIPGWDSVLLVSGLKRGSIYVVSLDADNRRAAHPISREMRTENRYRDITQHPDGHTIFVATDPSGLAEARDGGVVKVMQDGGAILAFRYVGIGDGTSTPATASVPAVPAGANAPPPVGLASAPVMPAGTGTPPLFTRRQVEIGKIAYDGSCAVCHGSTLTNGTFGTPLAGPYFRRQWSGRSVAALFEKSRRTMPPALPASLSATTYADIVAYVLEVNGVAVGVVALPPDVERLAGMRIP
jgi:PQQ-dependent dehydrogenase (s-GDH family)